MFTKRFKVMKKVFIVMAAALTMGGVSAMAAPATTSEVPSIYAPASDSVDDVLNEYEKYVDKCIALMKKAQAGDMSAMTEYAKLAEQAQKLAEKVEKVADSMSAAQIARYTKITQKLASAM